MAADLLPARGRRRHPVGHLDRDQPERLDRRDEEDAGKFPNDQPVAKSSMAMTSRTRAHRSQGPDRSRIRTSRSSSRRPPSASPPRPSTSTTRSWSARCKVTGLGLPSEMIKPRQSGAAPAVRPVEPDRPRLLPPSTIAYNLAIKKEKAKRRRRAVDGQLGKVKLDDDLSAAMAPPFVFDKPRTSTSSPRSTDLGFLSTSREAARGLPPALSVAASRTRQALDMRQPSSHAARDRFGTLRT